jgi:phosphoglycolate phosphatase
MDAPDSIVKWSRADMGAVPPSRRAVLIDLDGTLVDSAPDIAAAANRMLAEFGAPPLPPGTVRGFIGNGVPTLVRRVLAATPCLRDTGHDLALAAFDRHYGDCNGRHAAPYPGVLQGLSSLRRLGHPLACVTNKPQVHTLPLLDMMGLSFYFSAVVSGDSAPAMKPDPAPLLDACRRLGVEPAHSVMVGDSEADAAAARAAGMPVYIVRYGYHDKAGLAALRCNAFIDAFDELPGMLREQHQKTGRR